MSPVSRFSSPLTLFDLHSTLLPVLSHLRCSRWALGPLPLLLLLQSVFCCCFLRDVRPKVKWACASTLACCSWQVLQMSKSYLHCVSPLLLYWSSFKESLSLSDAFEGHDRTAQMRDHFACSIGYMFCLSSSLAFTYHNEVGCWLQVTRSCK